MATPPTESRAYSDLIAEIQRLQADRQTHVDALRAIDEVLGGIAQTLATIPGGSPIQLEVAPADEYGGGAVAASAGTPGLLSGTTRRKYNKLPQTGEDFVLSFIRDHGAPTTLEINAAWRAQGRGGVANNVIGRLLKQQLLVREPLADRRGSRYRVANVPAETAA